MPRITRASGVLTGAAVAAAALLAPAAVATAAPLSYPAVVDPGITVNAPFPAYDIAVECVPFFAQYTETDDGFYAELYHVPGGSLTLSFDCELDDVVVDTLGDLPDGGSAQSDVDGGITTITVDPNTSIDVFFVDSAATFEIDYYDTQVLPDPAGALLHSVTNSYTGTVAPFAFGSDSPVDDCVGSEGDRPYLSQVITVVTEGTYTFRFTGYTPTEGGLYFGESPNDDGNSPNPWGTTNPWSDPAIVIYSSFDPSNTDAGFIDCNDDSDVIHDFNNGFGSRTPQGVFLDDYFSELTVTLTPGVYTLITLPYDDPDLQLVSTDKSGLLGPAYYLGELDTTGSITADAQYWGEEGGILLGAQLAATGPSNAAAGLLGGVAALLLVAGAALVIVRRRTA